LANRYHLQNTKFIDPQPDGIYASVLQAADILIVNQRRTLIDMALPSKFTAYFSSARPVVAAIHPDSETAFELNSATAGLTCAPENPAALLNALDELANNLELRNKLGANGASYCKDHLDPERVLPQWAKFVEQLQIGTT
jgi:colanic acid biosynthesis glycosyl transferase WcaI